jgi:hypothetical protein
MDVSRNDHGELTQITDKNGTEMAKEADVRDQDGQDNAG